MKSSKTRRFAGLICSLSLIFFGILFSGRSWAAEKKVAILIPGTFNSIAPGALEHTEVNSILKATPYFSGTIIKAFENHGYAVKVIDGLSPLGSFEINGEITSKQIREWYEKYYPDHDASITLVGHSAGGFYGLWAASRLDLPIKKILLVTVPLEGDLFIDKIDNPALEFFSKYQPLGFINFFNWDGLVEISTPKVTAFLAQLFLPENIQIYSVGASQDYAPSLWNVRNAQYLSPLLSVSAKIMGVQSDGIVNTTSSEASNPMLRSFNGNQLPVQKLQSCHLYLEHPEQVLDYRLLKYLGTSNSEYIDQIQHDKYSEMIDLIQ